jgi:predicted transcriptional regulator
MRFPQVTEIRKMRKTLDITQSRLSAESGVSQSTIAKIEKGSISASYATVVKLFETLDKIGNDDKRGLLAKDVSSKDVITIQSNTTVHDASELMKSTGYSQLPVLKGDTPVGSISERMISKLILKGTTMNELANMPVCRIMSDSYPVVPENIPMTTVTKIMTDCDAVLVHKNGKIVGMITNADLLKLI